MTVSTQSASEYAFSDDLLVRDSGKVKHLRRSAAVEAGSYLYDGGRLVTGWHSHSEHQLEYAVGGVVEVETATAHYLLPPQQAVWIPAGVHHQATMSPGVRSVAVMFDPEFFEFDGDSAAILNVSTLLREMIIYAQRWPIDRLAQDTRSRTFFATLGQLVVEAIHSDEAALSLPTSTHSIVGPAMAVTRQNLHSISIGEVARQVSVSERTLRRLFVQETGDSWRTYLLHARMLRAMALLAAPDSSVQETARIVGFDNASSFTRAFSEYSGHTPSAYRQRSIPGLP